MRTQYYTAATLDGFIADENNSLDWLFQFGETPRAPETPATPPLTGTAARMDRA